ncbi:elongation factor P [Candidatus Poribacteria bacterium]|nr:elongation factor P [Candidatus Poribacteria bacterium]OUT59193.1 MAG: elongation factor P [bacterium TMED15]
MASLNDLRNGLVIRLNDKLYTITNCEHVKPGKGSAFARTKIKRVVDGAVLDRTFRSNETVETVRLESREMQYMYTDGNNYAFMDNESYEEVDLSAELIGEAKLYLKEGENITVKMDGDIPITIELPIFVVLQIVETDPGLRGDTVSGGTKPARLETGAVVQVPLFVENQTMIKVDTRDGSYVERA